MMEKRKYYGFMVLFFEIKTARQGKQEQTLTGCLISISYFP